MTAGPGGPPFTVAMRLKRKSAAERWQNPCRLIASRGVRPAPRRGNRARGGMPFSPRRGWRARHDDLSVPVLGVNFVSAPDDGCKSRADVESSVAGAGD